MSPPPAVSWAAVSGGAAPCRTLACDLQTVPTSELPMTSLMPPAQSFVRIHGDVLRNLGADKIETPSFDEIRLTYTNNFRAVQAEAALRDSVWGAKLIVDNQSITRDMPAPTTSGIQRLLQGVPGVAAEITNDRAGAKDLFVSSADTKTVAALRELLRENPSVIDGVLNVSVFHKPEAEPA